MNSEKAIEIRGLTKKFKNFKAVNGLDLTVYKGDVFGFLGPNGAGKSTTIRMMLSLISPTAGEINIFQKDLRKERIGILSKVGAIVEKPDLYGNLTAYKNLEILSKISRYDASKKKIMEILELVGLEKRYNSRVKTFSHGMKQRLGLAQALIHDPELIVLDEPTTGLDPQGMKEIRDLIMLLNKEKNKTIFFSSHILSEVQLICNRMIIINKGTAQVEGNVEDLLNSDSLSVKFRVLNPDKAKDVINNSLWTSKIQGLSASEIECTLHDEEIPDFNKFLVERGVLVSAIVPQKSLEKYFLSITSEKE